MDGLIALLIIAGCWLAPALYLAGSFVLKALRQGGRGR